jgi:hypothetical protein
MMKIFTTINNRIKPFYYSVAQKFIAWKYDYHDMTPLFDWKNIGVKRYDLINTIIRNNNYSSYLEIGCQGDINFQKIPIKDKVGVDPAVGGTIRMTSDAFFASNNRFFDLIFIDGLHTYEQTRRDIHNSYKWLNKGGTIVLHDMLPATWKQEHVPRINNAWNGDVWKVAYECKQLFGNRFGIIIADHGLGMIFKQSDEALGPDQTNQADLYAKKNYKDFLKDYNDFNLASSKDMEAVIRKRSF